MPGQTTHIFLVSAWFGLLFGDVEVSLNLIRKYLLNRVILVTHNYLWMIPLMDLIIFIVLGSGLALLALKWERLASWNWIIPVFSFPGFMSLYFVRPKISIYAALLLALGMSVQAGRIIARRGGLFDHIIRLTLPWMFAILISTILIMVLFFQ